MPCHFKTFFILCLFFTFLILPPFSLAEENIRIVTPITKTGERNELLLLRQATEEAQLSTASSIFKKTVNTLIERLKAAVERIENISERVSSRLTKIQKSNPKAKNLSTKYASISQQIKKLKAELKKTEDLSSKLLGSPGSQKEYQLFRKQVMDTDKLLSDVFTAEKDLVLSMVQFISPTIAPTAGAIKK